MSRTAIIVVAAGRGERLGHDLPKAFVPLAGQTLLERSLHALVSVPAIDLVQPVIAADDFERYAALGLGRLDKVAKPVPGGAERQDSVASGLAALPPDVDLVGVHDAARCLVSRAELDAVLACAARTGAALLAVPARDTIKRAVAGIVQETPARAECWAAQTPQVFRRTLLAEALERAGREGVLGTDDAQLVERLGAPVHLVEGSPRNLKITLPEDLQLAEGWLRDDRADEEEQGEQ